jgi:hypothetical protein
MAAKVFLINIACLCGYLFADTCGTEILLPQQCKQLVAGIGTVIQVCVADVNGDSTDDYVVAVQIERDSGNDVSDESDRALVVIVKKSGAYAIAAKSDKAIFCSTCGGVMGDPFESIEAGNKWFSISHSGGSRNRWSCTFKFGYSRRDKNWQLIEVENFTYDTLDEGGTSDKKTVHKPPKDFGLITFEEFNPDDYLGKGKK